jgi:hypothetical protein
MIIAQQFIAGSAAVQSHIKSRRDDRTSDIIIVPPGLTGASPDNPAINRRASLGTSLRDD